MSNNMVQRAWEELVISNEKGNRIVHYRLVDTTPHSLLAVVGIERSRRHITYTVTEDFLLVLGSTSTVHAGTKWKSRKAVVEFLSSITSVGGPIVADSNEQRIDSTPHPKKAWMAHFSSECSNPTDEEFQVGAEEGCGVHQANEGHVENRLLLWEPQSPALSEANVPSSSKAEGCRDVVMQLPGPSTQEANKKHRLEKRAKQAATSCASSAAVDKRRRHVTGVGPCRPNGSSSAASSRVSLNDAVRELRAGIRRRGVFLNEMIDELEPMREGLARLVPDVDLLPLPPRLPPPTFPPLPPGV